MHHLFKYETVNSLLMDTSDYKMDTSVQWTPTVGPCLSLLPLFDSLLGGHALSRKLSAGPKDVLLTER